MICSFHPPNPRGGRKSDGTVWMMQPGSDRCRRLCLALPGVGAHSAVTLRGQGCVLRGPMAKAGRSTWRSCIGEGSEVSIGLELESATGKYSEVSLPFPKCICEINIVGMVA